MKTKILVTGAAGFIGCETCLKLIQRGYFVVGIDNLNDYYPVSLKKDRLARLNHELFHFEHCDLADKPKLESLLKNIILIELYTLPHKQVFDIV